MNLAQPSSPVGDLEASEGSEDVEGTDPHVDSPPTVVPWMLGQNVTWLRRRAALSQTGLGDLVGVTRQTVSRWETGQCMPEREHLLALARLFGLTTHQLFERLEI